MTDDSQQPTPSEAGPQEATPSPGPADTSPSATPAPDTPLFEEPTMEGVQAGLPPQKVFTLDEKPSERR